MRADTDRRVTAGPVLGRDGLKHVRRRVDQVSIVTKPAGNTFDASETDERMDAIRLKEMLGEALTEQELMCLQIERNGFGCGTCARPADDGVSSS